MKRQGKVYTLISDGELQTETMGATARNAAKRKLSNLVFILDNNSFCAMGKTKEILDVDPKHLFYDWKITEIDGHDYNAIDMATSIVCDIPHLIIANTHKGFGVSRFVDNNLYHYKQLSDEEYNEALEELNG